MTVEITAKTALCGIVLHPASHTRSPAMHNAAFREMAIDAAYLAFDVAPEGLREALVGARELGVRQLAVSIPHKLAALDHLDEADPVAVAIGAVNTITFENRVLRGTNTDWQGAVCALERETALKGRHAVVLGAGGAARAVVYGLRAAGANVTVLNRTIEKAEAISNQLGAQDAGTLEDLGRLPHDILVNTTSVGLGSDVSPVIAGALRPGSVVMDAVYEPASTRLLKDATAIGARTIGGKWMLVHQAAEQIRSWTGQEAPLQTMAAAFDAAGKRNEPSHIF